GHLFLFSEYRYIGIFTGVFGVAIFLFLDSVKGFGTKILSGFIGMKIATYANARTNKETRVLGRHSSQLFAL
ncbi:pyrophosphate-energized vacuolar membrane proton pump 1-like, partial [Fagus crenata]